MKGIDFSMQVLSKAMSLRLHRHSAIAGNIANADTPGYRPKAVSFEDKLQQAVESHKAGRLDSIVGKTETVDDKAPRLDGNSVSADKQMAELTENAMIYSASAEFLKRKMSMIKRVIG